MQTSAEETSGSYTRISDQEETAERFEGIRLEMVSAEAQNIHQMSASELALRIWNVLISKFCGGQSSMKGNRHAHEEDCGIPLNPDPPAPPSTNSPV